MSNTTYFNFLKQSKYNVLHHTYFYIMDFECSEFPDTVYFSPIRNGSQKTENQA